MHFTGFQVHFEKIAKTLSRSIILRNDPNIPDGDYIFLPMYCNDKKCDCRRTLINVLQASPDFEALHAATISYGWEKDHFYKKWSSSIDDKALEMFRGPALDPFNTQSPHSNALLELFKTTILDEEYKKRLERQYCMFKYKTGMKMPSQLMKKIGIYEPCPCGSDSSFKMCCGKRKKRFGRIRR